MDRGGHTSQINTHVVTGFVDLWFRKDERQRVTAFAQTSLCPERPFALVGLIKL
jgi:hypothetical protein